MCTENMVYHTTGNVGAEASFLSTFAGGLGDRLGTLKIAIALLEIPVSGYNLNVH
jgi:hypothetical protein